MSSPFPLLPHFSLVRDGRKKDAPRRRIAEEYERLAKTVRDRVRLSMCTQPRVYIFRPKLETAGCVGNVALDPRNFQY